MKKLVIYILLLIIVFSFTSCADSHELHTVDDVYALREEVKIAWSARGNNRLNTFRYYGSCNGYHIVFFVGGPVEQAFTSKGVAGYVFKHSTGFSLKVYKDGEFIELKEAYESGLVSKEAVAKAAELHELELAKGEEKRRIAQEFVDRYGDYNKLRFYGDENGRYILFVKKIRAWEPLIVKQIAGSEFSHKGEFFLYVYIDGEFVDLEEAYEKGLISAEAIANAAKEHAEYGIN